MAPRFLIGIALVLAGVGLIAYAVWNAMNSGNLCTVFGCVPNLAGLAVSGILALLGAVVAFFGIKVL